MLPSFRHDLPSVEDYLHHRAPYCMVNQIVEISETTIRTSSCVDPHEAFIQGHFPGAPVIPGAMLQEMTTQSLTMRRSCVSSSASLHNHHHYCTNTTQILSHVTPWSLPHFPRG